MVFTEKDTQHNRGDNAAEKNVTARPELWLLVVGTEGLDRVDTGD